VVAFVVVFTISYAVFFVIKKTIGLRVTAEEEDAGLDIAEHGMYGYPEQFIPDTEIGAGSTGPVADRLRGEGRTPVTAMSTNGPGAATPAGVTS
jgi:Amt family ammonium transporter